MKDDKKQKFISELSGILRDNYSDEAWKNAESIVDRFISEVKETVVGECIEALPPESYTGSLDEVVWNLFRQETVKRLKEL